MNITSATVVLGKYCDHVFLYTNLPPPLPFNRNLVLQFDTSYDTGIEYVKTHFSIEPEVSNNRTW